jgi:hypothetical protein
MAITCILNQILNRSTKVRIFEISVPEVDVINIDTLFTWAAIGTTPMDADPEVKIMANVTPAAAVPVDSADISIYAVDRFGFHVQKTSATVPASAAVQTFRVWMWSKLWFEF